MYITQVQKYKARRGCMRIEVCDDVQADLDEMRHQLMETWQDAKIDTFIRSTELLPRIKSGVRYDLVFLDIIMKPENGIVLGHRIMQEVPDSKLVYVSNSREYGPGIYELNIFYYLLKPCDAEKLEDVYKRQILHVAHNHSPAVFLGFADLLRYRKSCQRQFPNQTDDREGWNRDIGVPETVLFAACELGFDT